MPFSNYGKQLVLRSAFGKTKVMPDTFYVALCLGPPDANSTGDQISEPTSTSYQRAVYANDADHWIESGWNETLNSSEIDYALASDPWGNLTHWAILDSPTSGLVIAYDTLVPALNVDAGDQAFIPQYGIALQVVSE